MLGYDGVLLRFINSVGMTCIVWPSIVCFLLLLVVKCCCYGCLLWFIVVVLHGA